jgi:hypothetical protein
MAVEIISDAISSQCASIVAVTGDADIQPAIEWVAKHRPEIKIRVYVPLLDPERNTRRTDYYRTQHLNVDCTFLPLGDIPACQLPNVVHLGDGKCAIRPPAWRKADARGIFDR